MLNGRELVLKALRFEEPERPPWVPFTGVHCAQLMGMDADVYLKSADNVVAGVEKAAEIYLADGVCPLFDLQIEAEVLGCELKWSKKNPPAVTSHVLEEGKSLADLPPFTKDSGRVPLSLEVTRRLKADIGDRVALLGLVCGPFTLAMHLAGSSFLTGMIEHPAMATEILTFCADIAKNYCGWYLEAGADAVALVDPLTSQISPRHFKKFVAPYVAPAIEYVRGLDGIITLFCCGDATKNIELMMQCKPHGIAFDEQVDMGMARELADKYQVAIEGNLHHTATLLFGNPVESVGDAKKSLALGRGRGFILSPGCDLTYDIPAYNLEAVAKYAVNGIEPSDTDGFLSLEDALSKCDASAEGFEPIPVVPGKVFAEVVTLDSEGCAPCQYMLEAIKQVMPHFGDKLSYRETLIKSLAGIKRVQELGVKTLPSILLNNEIVFDNIIPTESELKAEIEKRL